MKLRLKEEPNEWRKSVLLTALGLALLSSFLRWRGILNNAAWVAILGVLAMGGAFAFLRPGWFRGYYRFSMRAGFVLSHAVARVVLFLVFVFLITPLGLFFRLTGKDALRLKHQRNAKSYWVTARESGPLDRMF